MKSMGAELFPKTFNPNRQSKFLYLSFAVIILLSCFLCAGCKGNGSSHGKDHTIQSLASSINKAISLGADKSGEIAEKKRKIEETILEGDSLTNCHIIIDKENCVLFLRENRETIMAVPVCLGKNLGQKQRAGDHKTPEGDFKIISIEDASYFPYDFHDGRGTVFGTYGPWFFRLNTPQSTHIGIHGTMAPESMGKRESDGCIRLRNEDLEILKEYVKIGMPVKIRPDNVESS